MSQIRANTDPDLAINWGGLAIAPAVFRFTVANCSTHTVGACPCRLHGFTIWYLDQTGSWVVNSEEGGGPEAAGV